MSSLTEMQVDVAEATHSAKDLPPDTSDAGIHFPLALDDSLLVYFIKQLFENRPRHSTLSGECEQQNVAIAKHCAPPLASDATARGLLDVLGAVCACANAK